MQSVYRDGTLGEQKDFDLEGMQKLLADMSIDHVRVFEKTCGGKVGIIDIENTQLDARISELVIEKVAASEAKRQIFDDYEKLTGQRFHARLRR